MSLRPAEQKLLNLYNHLQADPDARGYSVMAVPQQATDLVITDTTEVEPVDCQMLELMSAIDMAEWNQLVTGSASEQTKALSIITVVSANTLLPALAVANTRLLFQRCFGAGSATRAAIDTLLATGSVSQAYILGYPTDTELQMEGRIDTANSKFGS